MSRIGQIFRSQKVKKRLLIMTVKRDQIREKRREERKMIYKQRG